MDFVFNWLLGISALFGMSHGELFYVASQIKNENPHEWRVAFFEHAANLATNATVAVGEMRQGLADRVREPCRTLDKCLGDPGALPRASDRYRWHLPGLQYLVQVSLH